MHTLGLEKVNMSAGGVIIENKPQIHTFVVNIFSTNFPCVKYARACVRPAYKLLCMRPRNSSHAMFVLKMFTTKAWICGLFSVIMSSADIFTFSKPSVCIIMGARNMWTKFQLHLSGKNMKKICYNFFRYGSRRSYPGLCWVCTQRRSPTWATHMM